MSTTITELDGQNTLISIGAMAKKSGVSASALRGYENLGLMRQYGIEVIRKGKGRFYKTSDAFKIAQIKAERMSRRNMILASQSTKHENY